MGDWTADLDGDYRILDAEWDRHGKRLTSSMLAELFDSGFDDLVEDWYGRTARTMLGNLYEIDTDAYQAVADAFEHAVRSGKPYFGIKKVDE